MLAAWSLVSDQLSLAPAGGILGIDWAGAAPPLKSAGFWDDDRDCLPEDLIQGLRVVCAEYAAWKLCDACREAEKVPKTCSKCGKEIAERGAGVRPRSAEDELRELAGEDGKA